MSGKSLRAGTVMAEIAELRRELLLRDAKLEAFTQHLHTMTCHVERLVRQQTRLVDHITKGAQPELRKESPVAGVHLSRNWCHFQK